MRLGSIGFGVVAAGGCVRHWWRPPPLPRVRGFDTEIDRYAEAMLSKGRKRSFAMTPWQRGVLG